MGMPAMPPGNIPVCLSYFAADEQTGVKIDLILVGERDQVIKLLECHRIVIAGPELEPVAAAPVVDDDAQAVGVALPVQGDGDAVGGVDGNSVDEAKPDP